MVKMEPNDLLTPEICFELISRGIEPKENQMLRRAQLRGILAKERDGITIPVIKKFPFVSEADEIEVTLNSLLSLVSGEDRILADSEIRRIESRLVHVQRRCSLLHPETDLEREKFELFESHLLIISGFLIEIKDNSVPAPAASSTLNSFLPSGVSVLPSFVKPISVNKWGIKFSGLSTRESVMSFLERINECCEARHISQEELFTSAVDLFTDTALLWFRNIRKEVRTWVELVSCLKRDFLPVDYEDDLRAEIRSRTQGLSENVLFYIIAIEALFNRLSVPPPEKEVIKQIRRNLNPFFAEKLVLVETTSLKDLKDKCRSIQELKVRSERYQPPPSKKQGLLEPDLACLALNEIPPVSVKKAPPFQSLTSSTSASLVCWNCQEFGHSHRECTATRTVFCYKCGTKGNFSTSCEVCSPKNEQTGTVPTQSSSTITPSSSLPLGTVPVNLRAARSKRPSQKPETGPSRPAPKTPSPRAATYVLKSNQEQPNDALRLPENDK